MLKNTGEKYGHIAKYLHWIMALLFVLMFIIAYIMINIPKSAFRLSLYDLHKSTGFLLFFLFVSRLGWRMINVQPSLPSSLLKWQQWIAKLTTVSLYILMCLMPMTGFLTSTLGGHDITVYHLFTISPLAHHPGASEFFSQLHNILSYLLIGIFTLHVIGALFHYYFLKDNILQRIWIR